MRILVLAGALTALGGCLHRPPVPAQAIAANDACTSALHAQDLERAQLQCEYALKFAPLYAEPINNLGLIALARGETQTARDRFIRALRLDPNLAAAHNNLGVLRRREGRLKAALESFRAALAVVPQYVEARLNVGATCVQLGDSACARKAYSQVLIAEPRHAEAHRTLGDLSLRGAPAEAANHYAEALLSNPADAQAWAGRGQALEALRRVGEAREAYERCVDEGDVGGRCRVRLLALPPEPPATVE